MNNTKQNRIKIRLSPDEKCYIIENASRQTTRQLADYIGCTRETIVSVLRKYNIKALKIRQQKAWTDDERNYILENYGILPIDDIIEHLNRSVSSIKVYVSKLRSEGYIIKAYSSYTKTVKSKIA